MGTSYNQTLFLVHSVHTICIRLCQNNETVMRKQSFHLCVIPPLTSRGLKKLQDVFSSSCQMSCKMSWGMSYLIAYPTVNVCFSKASNLY